MSRYGDAYLVARATASIGAVIKIIGILLGVVTFVGAMYAANRGYGMSEDMKAVYAVAGFIVASVIGGTLHLFGTLVSAQGQILKASLGGAVNSSPSLSDSQRAEVMSL